MQRAFVIRPFNHKKDGSGREIDFETIHEQLIKPAMEGARLDGGTTEIIFDSGDIREDMFGLIAEADLVICDITLNNPNVFYELGVRHALRKKNTVLIKGVPAADQAPFDIVAFRYLTYNLNPPIARAKVDELVRMIKETLAGDRATDSPVFSALPKLPNLDPAQIQVLPDDLVSEIECALALNSKGWLRLLAYDVTNNRFQWPALRKIGKAQWRLEDDESALSTWRRIQDVVPGDLDANFALANLLERQYRVKRQANLLTESDQSLKRILANLAIPPHRKAEAKALLGRNLKTLWRLEFENLGSQEERRGKATNRSLRRSYEGYYDAFLTDLNHYYSGLAALQMGLIAQSLAQDPAWTRSFNDRGDADDYLERLNGEIVSLRTGVRLALDAAVARDENDVWANISRADYMFLVEEDDQAVIQAYQDGMKSRAAFEWRSAIGQLKLFASLGIKAERAEKVILALGGEPPPPPKQHVVVVVGHRVDEPGSAQRRFPADKEPQARQLIQDELTRLNVPGIEMHVLASAAPGTDIIAHELCKALGIGSTICLPVPPEKFAGLIFDGLFEWRDRFFDLIAGVQPLSLSDREGLPRWLEGSGFNPWERGNRWVLDMALASGASRITLVALWDGNYEGNAPGGTGYMVRIAEKSGKIAIKRIDAKQLV